MSGNADSKAARKLIVQAQSRLLLVDQAEICFAAIDEGIIRVVTQTFEGHSKCRTLEELLKDGKKNGSGQPPEPA